MVYSHTQRAVCHHSTAGSFKVVRIITLLYDDTRKYYGIGGEKKVMYPINGALTNEFRNSRV